MKKTNSIRTRKGLASTAAKALKSKATSKTTKKLAGSVMVNRRKK